MTQSNVTQLKKAIVQAIRNGKEFIDDTSVERSFGLDNTKKPWNGDKKNAKFDPSSSHLKVNCYSGCWSTILKKKNL